MSLRLQAVPQKMKSLLLPILISSSWLSATIKMTKKVFSCHRFFKSLIWVVTHAPFYYDFTTFACLNMPRYGLIPSKLRYFFQYKAVRDRSAYRGIWRHITAFRDGDFDWRRYYLFATAVLSEIIKSIEIKWYTTICVVIFNSLQQIYNN